MNYETTANLAGDDDTRPQQDGSFDAGTEAYLAHDAMTEPPSDGEEEDISEDDGTFGDTIVDVEYDGHVYQVPRPLKDALLRQSDYTRKTMELADQRRGLAASKAELEHVQAMTIEELHAAARLEDIQQELADFAQHDWHGVDPDHPDLEHVRAAVSELAHEQAVLHGLLTDHFHHRSAREQHEMARTRAEADHAMAREIHDWSPERRRMLEHFAMHHGVPEEHLGHASPAELRLLHLAHIGAGHLERQRAANRGAVRPVAEVGGGAGGGPSDPTRMTMAQYRAWRAKQL